jgi:two-component sensor histidine kinase
VQNLGLAFHELCTNAMKYGALSQPGGKVEVHWEFVEHHGEPRIRLVWKERGGPPVDPPSRSGFGRIVAEQMIASSLDAVVETEFEPDGVRWTLEMPENEFTLGDGQDP